VAPPAVLLSGGETTVAVRAPGGAPGRPAGRGGRNSEFLLALAACLGGAPGIAALACDTDGIDGTEDNAGAIVYPDTLSRALSRGLAIEDALARHDSHGFFAATGDLVVTGPTLTNVNDFRAILILPRA
jgi:hydroxypyruvate reductase